MPSRRQFLLTTAAAGMGYWVAGGAQAKESRSPNERIAFASIGVLAVREAGDSEEAGKAGDMVAICDVDDHTTLNSRRAATAFPRPKKFNDFRKMLEEMGKSIDAVDGEHARPTSMPWPPRWS